MNLIDELHAIAGALETAGVTYAICGGVAVTIHGAVRTTKDLDLLVMSGDVERVMELARPLGYVFASLPMTFEGGTPRERHVRRVSKVDGDEHVMLDLIVADGALEGLLVDRVALELPAGRLSVVSRQTLMKMKRLAGRPQDLADLEALERVDEP